MWPNMWKKLGPSVRCYPSPDLLLEEQEVQYLSHCYSSRPYLQSVQAMAGRYASGEYSSYSNLSLHFNINYKCTLTMNCKGIKGELLGGTEPLHRFFKTRFVPLHLHWAEWPYEPLKRTTVVLKCKSTLRTGRQLIL